MHALGWDEHLPQWLKGPLFFGNAPWQWLALLLATLAAWMLGRLLAAGVVALLRVAARRTETQTDDELVEVARRPLRLVLGVILFRVGLELMELSPALGSAGVQLSVAQPVRLGDSVTIENEFGEIEEIHLTYVVVNLWDERRLVVPIARLLDQTFVNWTRTGSPIMGTVFFHVDYAMPLQPI